MTCSKDVTIQAKSSKVVPILTDRNIESIQIGVFEVDLAFNSKYGLFAPISEFNCANALRLEVFNTTNYPTTVKAGTTIGHIYNKHFKHFCASMATKKMCRLSAMDTTHVQSATVWSTLASTST